MSRMLPTIFFSLIFLTASCESNTGSMRICDAGFADAIKERGAEVELFILYNPYDDDLMFAADGCGDTFPDLRYTENLKRMVRSAMPSEHFRIANFPTFQATVKVSSKSSPGGRFLTIERVTNFRSAERYADWVNPEAFD